MFFFTNWKSQFIFFLSYKMLQNDRCWLLLIFCFVLSICSSLIDFLFYFSGKLVTKCSIPFFSDEYHDFSLSLLSFIPDKLGSRWQIFPSHAGSQEKLLSCIYLLKYQKYHFSFHVQKNLTNRKIAFLGLSGFISLMKKKFPFCFVIYIIFTTSDLHFMLLVYKLY